ncbi:MAG: hypothetical protein D6736_03725 [Nitrospinota bacterium]|nr:MAG: hypothetical protein D6736_03725 [Nitrospinota bacterium]
MSEELDALIRKGKMLEDQIEQLQEELTHLRAEIAERMGEKREYYGKGVAARKWARVRWEIYQDLLLEELSPEALDYFKEVVFTKEKLDQAVKAGHLPPRLYERAVRRVQEGWNVSLKVLDSTGEVEGREG